MDKVEFGKAAIMFSVNSYNFLSKYSPDTLNEHTEELAVNTCGDCTACCIYPAIASVEYEQTVLPSQKVADKPFGTKCTYCSNGGCSVYNNRPSVCKGYMCLWKFGLTAARPNVSGVAWSAEPDKETYRHWVLVGHCADVFPHLESQYMLDEVSQLLTLTVMGLEVSCAVLRSKTHAARLRQRGSRMVVDICDMDNDVPMLETLRTIIARPCKQDEDVDG